MLTQILGVTEWLGGIFSALFGDNAWLATIIISMIPMIELKGGIVFGRNPDFWGEHALGGWQAYACGLAGGLIVILALAFLLQPVFSWLKKTKAFRRFVLRLEKSFRKKAGKIDAGAAAESDLSAVNGGVPPQAEAARQAEVLPAQGEALKSARKKTLGKMLGVFLFVAVPLPLTGVWTGTAIAVFLGLKKWQTVLAALLGNAVAGIVILLVSEVFFEYLDIVFYVILSLVLLVILFGAGKMILDSRREKRTKGETDKK